MITTIIFDLSEVLLRGIVGSHTFLEKNLGFPVKDEYFYNDAFDQFMLGKISEDVYWQEVIKKNEWNISIDILKKSARRNFTEIKGTREIIKQLKEKGYTLILLSNHGKEWVEYIESQYAYRTLFNHVVYSYDVHLAKPNKDIFKHVLTTFALTPEECLLIDDSVKNVTAAKESGINTIIFKTSENLKNDLEKFNINFHKALWREDAPLRSS